MKNFLTKERYIILSDLKTFMCFSDESLFIKDNRMSVNHVLFNGKSSYWSDKHESLLFPGKYIISSLFKDIVVYENDNPMLDKNNVITALNIIYKNLHNYNERCERYNLLRNNIPELFVHKVVF